MEREKGREAGREKGRERALGGRNLGAAALVLGNDAGALGLEDDLGFVEQIRRGIRDLRARPGIARYREPHGDRGGAPPHHLPGDLQEVPCMARLQEANVRISGEEALVSFGSDAKLGCNVPEELHEPSSGHEPPAVMSVGL